MNGLNINDKDIIEANNTLSIRFILKKMNTCKSFNRFETIRKVNSEPSLRSLHSTFHPSIDYLSI